MGGAQCILVGFPGGASGKRKHANQRTRHERRGFDCGSGRCPGRGHGNPPQYSCLENPIVRGAWQAIVHGAKSPWSLKELDMAVVT